MSLSVVASIIVMIYCFLKVAYNRKKARSSSSNNLQMEGTSKETSINNNTNNTSGETHYVYINTISPYSQYHL